MKILRYIYVANKRRNVINKIVGGAIIRISRREKTQQHGSLYWGFKEYTSEV